MKCAWNALLGLLPQGYKTVVDKLSRETLQELRLRCGRPALLIRRDGRTELSGSVSAEDIQFVINAACRYSPWSAESAAAGAARAALFAAIEEYYSKNREAASRVKDAALKPEAIATALADGQTAATPSLLPHSAAALESALSEARQHRDEADGCQREWIVAYLRARLDEVIEAIMKKKGALPVSDEARAAIEGYREAYGRWLADTASAETAAAVTARRESLLAAYLESYKRLIDTEREEGEEEE